ncbi:hypothetical protein N7535_002208 [Penicillium sp. DV-2018c]|nr:hypothetical protein N7461_004547 [Penicillium sp. DV-2018c]KAJ5583588.1 hypothetical protein N7535_002208 [Penicillium sp. DV-2018c]
MASTASDFLAAKIEELENGTSYTYMIRIRSTTSTLRVLKRQKNDLQDGLLERAYRDLIVSRVVRADRGQRVSSFNQSRFKKDVNKYYSTVDSNDGTAHWCHVIGGFFDKTFVKAAHIVPKSLDREELAHLFGDEDVVISLPQNALSLHHKVESLLDRGDIAIVPMPGTFTAPTEWRCIVLNESLNMDVIYTSDGYTEGETPFVLRVKDLDNRPLKFLSDNRPRRRYLYLRFLISYMWGKRASVAGVEQKVESNRFWPSAGSYLQRSTLQTLARCVSGCEIPEYLTAEQTFTSSETPERGVTAGMNLAADLISSRRVESGKTAGPDLVDAVTETMKRL